MLRRGKRSHLIIGTDAPCLSPVLWVLALCVLLTVFKSYWVFHAPGPRIFGDELIYRQDAFRIFHGQLIKNSQYPPLYPLFLSLAFLSRGHWYQWMLFINSLVSSAAIVPLYLIARRYLPTSAAVMTVIMAALMPFHAVYPGLLESENLFLVLFLFVVYFAFERSKKGPLSGALLGAFCALSYLTRYLALPAIPLLLAVWWFVPPANEDNSGSGQRSGQSLSGLLAFCGGFLVVYGPWLIAAHFAGMRLTDAMGFRFVEHYEKSIKGAFGPAPVRTLGGFAVWSALYAAYLVLAVAPFLPVAMLYFPILLSKRSQASVEERIYFLALALLTLAYFLLAVQHSWGAKYNTPIPQYLLGRYLMQLTPLYILGGFIALRRLESEANGFRTATVVPVVVISVILVYIAREILYDNLLRNLTSWFADVTWNSPDSFFYREHSVLIGAIATIMTTGICLGWQFRQQKERRVVHMAPVIGGILILFQSFVFSHVCVRTMTDGWPVHGRMLAEVFEKDLNQGAKAVVLTYDVPNLSTGNLSAALEFWGLPLSKISLRPGGQRAVGHPSTASNYILSSICFDKASAVRMYYVDGTEYCIYKMVGEELPQPVIEDCAPLSTEAGKGFNFQQSGRSHLRLRGQYVNTSTVVVFDGSELETTIGKKGIMSAIVPATLYSKQGEYKIYLLDKTWGRKSKPMYFEVK